MQATSFCSILWVRGLAEHGAGCSTYECLQTDCFALTVKTAACVVNCLCILGCPRVSWCRFNWPALSLLSCVLPSKTGTVHKNKHIWPLCWVIDFVQPGCIAFEWFSGLTFGICQLSVGGAIASGGGWHEVVAVFCHQHFVGSLIGVGGW